MKQTRVPSLVIAAALLVAPLFLGGCVLFDPPEPTAPRDLALNRDTPKATYTYFKTMVTNNQWAGEWSVFSPNFKRLLNESVGRNIDAGDYNLARQTIADNSQADMQLLMNSTYVSEKLIGRNAAVVTLEAGGRSLSPRLVKLTRWELQVVGDETPYGDFVTNAGEAVRIAQDGSITVTIRPPQATAGLLRTFRPEQIEAFRVESQWYVDDFGGLDQQIAQQAGDGEAPAPQRTPQPQPRPEPAATGWGSPDNGAAQPPSPPPGWGSPDTPAPGTPRPPRVPPRADENLGWGSPDG